ncbi:MAG: hypothetical protein HY815_34145, partial [Candidatus Riflebacteria bacterium]|nr:hypothetical protein [Candidatus Riflebacteria bacterium]
AHLQDRAGDDRYYAKGRYRTSYGDAGFFDAFSQGCALGFRGAASGGLALLSDLGGNDRYEAGHFSQGGGYYFGWGLLHDRSGNDRYLGSRYAQAFAAHEAVGYLEDGDGDDRYGTLQSVAQAIAWDRSVVALVDRSGNDLYDGGACTSIGASAQNGFSLLMDLAGDDVYRLGSGPGRAGPNEYHGGESLSVFVDVGGGVDRYDPPGLQNDSVLVSGAVGIFADLAGSVPQELTRHGSLKQRVGPAPTVPR